MTFHDLDLAPELPPEIATLIAALGDSTREWRENLEEPVPEAMVWAPYEDGPSIGGMILHMIGCEHYWIEKFVEGIEGSPDDPAIQYDDALDQYGPVWPRPPFETIEWYLALHDTARARIVEKIRAHADPTSIHHQTDSSMTYRWILAHLVEHDSYHGGQAVLLHEMFKKLNPNSMS